MSVEIYHNFRPGRVAVHFNHDTVIFIRISVCTLNPNLLLETLSYLIAVTSSSSSSSCIFLHHNLEMKPN